MGVGLLILAAAPAFAGPINEIILGGSNGYPVSFTGTGGGAFTVNFNIFNLGATGTGPNFGGTNGFYSILNNGATITSDGSCGPGCWNLVNSAPVLFKLGSTAGASDLLTGNLQLVDIAETAQHGGVFNDKLVINFTATGGAWQSFFHNDKGFVQLTIRFKTTQDLATILSGQQLTAKVISGAVIPVSEPASLAMLGAGLLGLSSCWKRRKLFG